MSHYTDERQAQIVLSLLKSYGIRRIVGSPGATNIPILGSIQNDSFFEVYSVVDERSAAYIACGIAEETGEPVALSCTGATASRNYMPGLTEAFYRKLPVLAITSFNGNHLIGNLVPQNLDRTNLPNDIVCSSVQLPIVNSDADAQYCNRLVNKALIHLKKDGGGPVHINLTTNYMGTFNTKELPKQPVIGFYRTGDDLPSLENKKIGIFIGSHKKFSNAETRVIERFCAKYGAVVFCDHTSSYKGSYRIQSALVANNIRRLNPLWSELLPDLVLHLGEVSGDYPSTRILEECNSVWRISEDGELRDRGGRLTTIYHGSEYAFFDYYTDSATESQVENKLYLLWKDTDKRLRSAIPELPFSNTLIAQQLSKHLPESSYLNLGILNTLRNWNFFNVDKSIRSNSNVGGFGIDGCVSTLVGASLVSKETLCFGVVGDLAFFYDVNVIGNRHLGNNVRILLINNGCGTEFKNYNHFGSQFGEQSNELIAAGGHFNSCSDSNVPTRIGSSEERVRSSLAASWAKTLGFEYLSCTNGDELEVAMTKFIAAESSAPIILECFTEPKLESKALELMSNLEVSSKESIINSARKIIPTKLEANLKGFAKKIIK
ncbi:TPA: hypothetical protein RQL27_002812 [Vibrio vulnificus]|nr:hypothetical protein [Vibrio vulnificus]